MSTQLRHYLIDTYESQRSIQHSHKFDASIPIQLDDQDDNDKFNEFCNIYCIIGGNNTFTIELVGTFPITQSMSDLADIYNGITDRKLGRLTLRLNISQIEAIMDLADRIRKTSFMGETVGNSNWLSNFARTISSLYRFVRIIKEYRHSHWKADILSKE